MTASAQVSSAALPEAGGAMYDRYPARPANRYGYTGPMDSRLSGTRLVADDLWLMAHDDATGKPLLLLRALGLGLAGGLLSELMLARCIRLRSDTAVVIGQHVPRTAAEGHAVLRLIAGEPVPLPVRDWLGFLALKARDDVAGRLERAGYLARAGRRLPWRPQRWVPVDPNWAFAPLLRVRSALDPARQSSEYEAVLAGLSAACGLGFRIGQYLSPGRTVEEATRLLEAGLRELIAQTQAAADSAVQSSRG
jgi:hypothetical protein